MGLGDQLMATGMARGALARGKRIAFGDGKKIRWDHNSETIFRNNPNIARPGTESRRDIEWIYYYKGHRIYNTQRGDRWIWHPEKFKAQPGEMFFSRDELSYASRFRTDFILIEPNVPFQKPCGPNKQWSVERYESVADDLSRQGHEIYQFVYSGARHRLKSASHIMAPNFRSALALLSRARLAILPEGGLHHGAAAVGVKAVVLFGGFIPPSVTGYDTHINLTGGAVACGSHNRCQHCIDAMNLISVEEVLNAANGLLSRG